MAKRQSIAELLASMSGETRVEALDLVNRLGVNTVRELTGHSAPYLLVVANNPPSLSKANATISELEQLLRQEYNASLADAEQISTRDYVIIDQGRTVVVNGALLKVPTGRAALPKPQMLQIYTLHGNGKTAEEILEEMRRVTPNVTMETVQGYLRMAKLIQEPPAAMPEAEAAGAGARQPAVVSGAPPPSPYAAANSAMRRAMTGLFGQRPR